MTAPYKVDMVTESVISHMAARIAALEAESAALRFGHRLQNGYAPGDYTCLCRSCGQSFIGDKRAVTCLSCADAAINAAIAAIGEAKPASAEVKPVDEKPFANWLLGDWFKAKTIDDMEAFYWSRLPAIREAARERGYAIGLHGSMRRDFDLMAMPWREDASDIDVLAHDIAKAACGITRDGPYQWEEKPLGRMAVSIPICWTDHSNPDFKGLLSVGHIDLSVIPAQQPRQESEIAAEALEEAAEKQEPVAWALEIYDFAEIVTDKEIYTEQVKGNAIPLYTHPAPTQPDSEQAKDAARYRWLRNYEKDLDSIILEAVADGGKNLDAAIDAAMKVGADKTGEM